MPTLITNPNDLALNEREEILQFIGRPPSVFLRFGIMAVAGVVSLLLGLAYFIQYPDVLTAKVILTTENPPIRLVSKMGGRVSQLLVKNNEIVQSGQILAVMENTANYKDVLALEQELLNNSHHFTIKAYRLGSLQTIYSTFCQNLKAYQYFHTQNGVAQKIQFLEHQVGSLNALNDNLIKQKEIQSKEFTLTEKELSRQKMLYTEGVISIAEYEKFNAQYWQQKRQIEANEAAFINNQMQAQQNRSQINDLKQGKNDTESTQSLTLNEDIHRLQAAIQEWKQTYLFIAPISGQISFAKVWSEQQSIASGEDILTIVPHTPNTETAYKIIGKATLPIAQSGKVKQGLNAHIQIDAFPQQQYGVLRGTVTHMALVPQKEDYLLDIALPHNLNTSYGKTLNFRQEMQGTAHIITEDRRVIERIFDRFKDLLKNRN